MADTKKLNLEITVDKKALTLLKESTKTTIAEIKALNTSLTAQIKSDALVKIQVEKTAQAQIKADAQKTAIELKANKQKEAFDYKQVADQKSKAEKQLLSEIKTLSQLEAKAKKEAESNFAKEFKKLLQEETKEQKSAAKQREDIAKSEAEFKKLRSQEILKYNQQIYNDELAFKKLRSQNILDTNTKRDSGLKGQSVTLGSEQALQQQKKYYSDLFKTLESGSPQFIKTKAHLEGINAKLKDLQGTTKTASLSVGDMIKNFTALSIGGFALTQTLGFLWTAFKGSAELSTYKERFEKLAGGVENAKDELFLLRKASAGNLNDAELIKYSNNMQLLGFNSTNTAKILDIVERASDDTGVSFSEGTSALQKYILTGSGKGLRILNENIAAIKKETDRLTQATGRTTDALSDEELQTIRLNAIINLFGDSLPNIIAKQKDVGDSANSLSVDWDNLTNKIGDGVIAIYDWLKAGDEWIDKQREMADAEFRAQNPDSENAKKWRRENVPDQPSLDQRVKEATDRISKIVLPDVRPDRRDYVPVKERTTGSRGSFKKDVEEIKEVVQAVDEMELLKQQIFGKISQGGLSPTLIGNNGLPNAGLDINDTRKLREQVEVSILDAQLNKEKKDPMEGFNKLTQDSSALVSDVSNVMSILGMGTDSWAGQVLGTFDSVISLLSSIGGIAQKLGQGDFVGAIFSGIGSLFGGRSGGDSVGRGNNLSLANLSRGGGGGIFGSLLGLVGLIPGVGTGVSIGASVIGGVLGGGGRNIGNLAMGGGGSRSINVNFGNMKFKLKGEDIYGSVDAYTTNLNNARY